MTFSSECIGKWGPTRYVEYWGSWIRAPLQDSGCGATAPQNVKWVRQTEMGHD